MQRFAKKSFWEAKNRKMKTLEIRHSRAQNSGNAAFCEKKYLEKQKSKNENFGKKTFQIAELRKCSVLRKKSFWEAKNKKMKNKKIKTNNKKHTKNKKKKI